MIYLVAYDVGFECVGDRLAIKRLVRIRKILRNVGYHRQLSFFECIAERKSVDVIRREVEAVMDPDSDSLRIYPVCDACLKRAVIQGIGERINLRHYEIV